MPSFWIASRSRSSSLVSIHAFMRAADNATKRREVADFDSPAPSGAGTSPSLPWPGTSGGSSPSSRPDTADAPRPSGREGPGNADIRPFNRFLRPIQRQASPQPAKIILGNQPRPQSDRLLGAFVAGEDG